MSKHEQTWFQKLTGFEETSTENIRQKLSYRNDILTSSVNGSSFHIGKLEIASLSDLRERNNIDQYAHSITVSETIADVQQLHIDKNNANSLFQVASQFNLLEMVSPAVTPENGVSIYENDNTQGPACPIACGAATIYRNYFVPVDGDIGQTADKQIDCLSILGDELENDVHNYWTMSNGYALFSNKGALALNKALAGYSEIDVLKQKLQVGIQWNAQVTCVPAEHCVSQVYCSALPVAYCNLDSFYIERFACLILEAMYEATLHAALINYENTGNKVVYLTLVGGGVFGNDMNWIIAAISKALQQFRYTPLDVRIVSYQRKNHFLNSLLTN